MNENGALVAQDPDELQQEIERTREELAQTFDAIADKVSPKRAVSRTTTRVKGKVGSLAGGSAGELRKERVLLVAAAILGIAFAFDRWRRHR
jgi:hypothetical protein